MAKGKIKSLVAPWQNIEMVRNGVKLVLTPTDLERGTGKYPGIKFSESPLTLEQLENVLTKPAVQADAVLKRSAFVHFIVGALNDVSKLTWRTLVADKPANVDLSDSQKSTILSEYIEALNRALDGDRKEREKDASFYRRAAMKLLVEAKGEKDAKKKAELQVNAKSMLAIAKQKDEEELKAILESADGLELGLDDDDSTDEVETSPEQSEDNEDDDSDDEETSPENPLK
jgi:hypothetical protein